MPDATNNPTSPRPYSHARIYRQGCSRGKRCQGTDPLGTPCPHQAVRVHSIEWRDSNGLNQYLPLSLCDQHQPASVA